MWSFIQAEQSFFVLNFPKSFPQFFILHLKADIYIYKYLNEVDEEKREHKTHFQLKNNSRERKNFKILWEETKTTIPSYLECLSLKTHYSAKLWKTNSAHLIFVKTEKRAPNMNLKTQPFKIMSQKRNY